MKLQAYALANAAAVTTIVVYIACALFIFLLPDFSVSIMKSWFHGVDISKIAAWNVNLGSFILGIVTLTAYVWGTGYIFAKAYNLFAQ